MRDVWYFGCLVVLIVVLLFSVFLDVYYKERALGMIESVPVCPEWSSVHSGINEGLERNGWNNCTVSLRECNIAWNGTKWVE